MTSKIQGRYWLVKTEPSAFSIEDLKRSKRERWDGVRNYQARNFLRAMKKGDRVFIYHSSISDPVIVGIGRVARTAYPDPSQFDKNSPYFDRASHKADPRWTAVDISFVKCLRTMIPLSLIKIDPQLQGMLVAKRGSRLSVQPVSSQHARLLLAQK